MKDNENKLSARMQYELNRIERMYPSLDKLNKKQALIILNIGVNDFSKYVEQNMKHKLPKYKSKNKQRRVKPYKTYEFKVWDLAQFLAGEKNDDN